MRAIDLHPHVLWGLKLAHASQETLALDFLQFLPEL